MPLPMRHEHDHMPIPARHGGNITHCVCMNCHELKDRTRVGQLDASRVWLELTGLFLSASPMQRIMLAKLFALLLDATAAKRAGR